MCKAITSTIVVLVNLLFIPIGLALLIFGAMLKWKQEMLTDRIVHALLEDVKDQAIRDSATSLCRDILSLLSGFGLTVFLIGIFFFILSLCAVFGVCCKSKMLLIVYVVLLLVIFLGLFILTIVFATRTSWFHTEIQNLIKDTIVRTYQMDNDKQSRSGFKLLIDTIQENHKCCGSKNYQDFWNTSSFDSQPYKIPASCCKNMQDTACWANPTKENSYMDNGCTSVFWSNIDPYYKTVLYVLIGFLCVTALFIALAIYLLTRFTKDMNVA